MPDDDLPSGAILQRDKQTYAIVPRTPVGLVTPDHLEKIAAVVRKFKIPIIKITSGQRFALVGVKPDDLDAIWSELELIPGNASRSKLCLHYVQACPGTAVCKYGMQDSIGLGQELEALFTGRDLPAKVKIGVSGCPFCCGESFVRDIGVFGKKRGWTLILGGSSARRPRIGDVVAENISKDEVIALIEKFFAYYAAKAKQRERTARFIDRVGVEDVKEYLGL